LLFAGGRVDCGHYGRGVLSLSKLSTKYKGILGKGKGAGGKAGQNVDNMGTLDNHFSRAGL
jgi:hypothetical protein